MSDKTTNYGLTKPLSTDYYDIEIQNGNMEIIDDQLKTLDSGKEALIKNVAAKTSLVDTDAIPLTDSAASNVTKKITFTNLKTVLKTYFDTLYNKYTHPTYTASSSGLYKVTVDGTGHVSAAASVAKTDITALGIPAQDTVTAVVDNLTSTDTAKALSASQGKVLSDLVSTKVSNTRKVNGKELSSDIILTTDDIGIIPTGSYLAFCANINTTSLDVAFGKNNETLMKGIGNQLAMYAWFKGDSPVTYPFTKLKNCQTLQDCLTNASDEIFGNTNLLTLIATSPYANGKLYSAANIPKYKRTKPAMNYILSNAAAADTIRGNTAALAALRQNRIILGTPGAVSWTVPHDFPSTFITVALVGGGGAPKCGEYKHFVLDVTPEQIITGSLGVGLDTVFGGQTAIQGKGALQSGALLVKATNGEAAGIGVGGEGGFEGGPGGDAVYGSTTTKGGVGDGSLDLFLNSGGTPYKYGSNSNSTNGEAGGGGGYSSYTSSSGSQRSGGGGGYGGGGGATSNGSGNAIGGSGIIVIMY